MKTVIFPSEFGAEWHWSYDIYHFIFHTHSLSDDIAMNFLILPYFYLPSKFWLFILFYEFLHLEVLCHL